MSTPAPALYVSGPWTFFSEVHAASWGERIVHTFRLLRRPNLLRLFTHSPAVTFDSNTDFSSGGMRAIAAATKSLFSLNAARRTAFPGRGEEHERPARGVVRLLARRGNDAVDVRAQDPAREDRERVADVADGVRGEGDDVVPGGLVGRGQAGREDLQPAEAVVEDRERAKVAVWAEGDLRFIIISLLLLIGNAARLGRVSDAARLGVAELRVGMACAQRAGGEAEFVLEDGEDRLVHFCRLLHEGLDCGVHALVDRRGVAAVRDGRVRERVVLGDVEELDGVGRPVLVGHERPCHFVSGEEIYYVFTPTIRHGTTYPERTPFVSLLELHFLLKGKPQRLRAHFEHLVHLIFSSVVL